MQLLPFAVNHPSSETAISTDRRRTIVVDDSETMLHAICSLLEHHHVAQIAGRATSGKKALAMAARLDHQFALVDFDMPEMSGLTTALLIAQSQPATRVILMSMDPTPQQRVAGIACGACALISKPRFLKELAAVFEQDAWATVNATIRVTRNRKHYNDLR